MFIQYIWVLAQLNPKIINKIKQRIKKKIKIQTNCKRYQRQILEGNRVQSCNQNQSIKYFTLNLLLSSKCTLRLMRPKMPRIRFLGQTFRVKYFPIEGTKYSVIQNASKQLGLSISQDQNIVGSYLDWDLKWTDTNQGNYWVSKMTKTQRINYFIGISSIARKNLLMDNLYTMKKFFPDDYDFFPETFLFPKDSRKIIKFQKSKIKQNKKVVFIVKPQAGCQGRGIYLCQDFSQIETNSNSIVQQYLLNPMLYGGLKFDFRVYVLLKNISPLEIYLYKQGLVRFATEKYEQPSKLNIDDMCLHLTNYAINKNSPKYSFNKTMSDLNFGHKKSLAQFFKSLNALGYKTHRFWRQIKQCVIKTILSVQPHLHCLYRKAQPKNQDQSLCFQLLGFDFIVNSESKVYLLEVNQSPSFSTQTPLDFLVKNFLIKDTLKIIMHEKENRRVKLQLKTRKIKTDTDDVEKLQKINKKNDINVQALPQQILGNYERIYPVYDQGTQQNYQRMLVTVRANYHKANLQRIDSPNKNWPKLKLRTRRQTSFGSLQFINQINKQNPSLKFLTLSNESLSPKIENNNNKIASLRKNYILSKSLNKSITETSSMVQALSSLNIQNVRQRIRRKKVNDELAQAKRKDTQEYKKINSKYLSQINASVDINNPKSFISLKKVYDMPKTQILIEDKQISNSKLKQLEGKKNRSSSTNNDLSKLSQYKGRYDIKTNTIRSHLKKYIKFLNPIEKAACHRASMEDQKNQSQKQTIQ